MSGTSYPSPARLVRIRADNRRFRVVGTGRWADFGDAWLCTHDLLHHEPTDQGRLQDEMRTFGVECWIESAGQSSKGIDYSSLAGSIFQGYKDSRTMDAFVLPDPPAVRIAVPPDHLARFEEVVNLGFAEAANDILSRYEELFECEMPQAELDRFVDESNQARAVGWMAYGYERAQQRYPDRAAAQDFFSRVERFFHHIRNDSFTEFALELDEQALAMRPRMPYLRKVWAECATG